MSMREFTITEHDGFVVVDRTTGVKRTPLACALCNRLLRSIEDAEAIDEFECCAACAMRWAHPDRGRWLAGWRPTTQQINDDLLSRPGIQIPFFGEP